MSDKPKSDTMPIDQIEAWAISPPDGFDGDFRAHESMAFTAEKAWERFCHPSLRREGFEADGFKAVPIRVTIHLALDPPSL